MLCSSCGYELFYDTFFCPKCGHKRAVQKQKEDTTVYNSCITQSELNRDVIVNYLFDVRALEVSKLKLLEKINKKAEKCKHLGIPQLFTKPNSYTDYLLYIVVLCLIFTVILFIASIFNKNPKRIVLYIIFSIIMLILSITCFVFCFVNKSVYKRKYETYNNHVSNDKKRVELELAEKDKLEKEIADICKELNEAENLLGKSYNVNIIPKQYRDIYSIFYLYEYLSTSQESLQSALLHYNLEEIKTKIDEIIRQQSEIILQQAIQTAHLEVIEKQTTKILKHAAETEKNTALAAQYAQIAANNAEACAWINLAQYIKD